MGDAWDTFEFELEQLFNSIPCVCDNPCPRKRHSEDPEKENKKPKTDECYLLEDILQQLSDGRAEIISYLENGNWDSLEQIEMTSDQSKDTFTTQELSRKLVPTLEALILKGCFDTCPGKSALFKEPSKYCAKTYSPMKMMTKNSSTFNLFSEQKLMDFCAKNCPNLKCLRLSYCVVSLELLESIKTSFRSLQCLHLEYISGLQTAEEWSAAGKIFNKSLVNLSFNMSDNSSHLNSFVKELNILDSLALEEYDSGSGVLSWVSPHMRKLSLINQYKIDEKEIKGLALRCGKYLRHLEVVFDSYNVRRANALGLFAAICQLLKDLREFRFKFISGSDMKPLFKLTKLMIFDVQFLHANFIEFPTDYHMESLRTLSMTKALLTPRRVHSMTRAFPLLEQLTISGQKNREKLDYSVFCCECKQKDKISDNCSLCYKNCVISLLKFSNIKTLTLNYIKIKSWISTALPFITSLNCLVINPYDCLCGQSLLTAVTKMAEKRQFKLIVRQSFIKDAIKEQEGLPDNLKIIDIDN